MKVLWAAHHQVLHPALSTGAKQWPNVVACGPAETSPDGSIVMHLLRAWESQYLPHRSGELRLTSARAFRDLEEDVGIGDADEGAQRALLEGHVTAEWQDRADVPAALPNMEIDIDIACVPNPVLVKGVRTGTTSFLQEMSVEDSGVPPPYLLCLARQPTNEDEWTQLEAALPSNRDAWTYVSDLDQLKMEIECGIDRWLKLNGAASHKIETFHGPVQYSYDDFPKPKEPEELLQREELLFGRWMRKRELFQHQREYRLGFYISSPEISVQPDHIDIELTGTGIRLFQHWEPPRLWEPIAAISE